MFSHINIELDNKLAEKNAIIKKLSSQIHYYENHPSKEQYGYITELEIKVSSLERDVKQANIHIRDLENN